jgi:hypothetical protein
MRRYNVYCIECLTFHGYSGTIYADDEMTAREKAKEIFLHEHPAFSAHMKIVWCHEIL